MRRWAWAGLLALAMTGASSAQVARQLPANGKLGELIGQPRQPFPLLRIGNQILRLAPGGRLYDQQNRSIVHGSLPEWAYVLFLVDPNGDVSQLYLLRADELELLERTLQR